MFELTKQPWICLTIKSSVVAHRFREEVDRSKLQVYQITVCDIERQLEDKIRFALD